MNKILVTGAAGFIGFHLCKELIRQDCTVVGLDNINDYYDKNLKLSRLKQNDDHWLSGKIKALTFTQLVGGSQVP